MPGVAHCELQRRVPVWLNGRVTGRGLRAGMEIRLGDGYIADVVALCSFQHRYCEGYGFTRVGGRINGVWAEAAAAESLLVFEAKATRADFLSTFGAGARHANRLDAIGTLHWVVAAEGVCSAREVPEPWGLLVEANRGLREMRAPKACPTTVDQVCAAAYEILWYGLDARPWKARPQRG